MELSPYTLRPIREDAELTLFRGQPIEAGAAPILLLAPSLKCPTLDTLEKINREHALRTELDPTWAVRPCDLAQYREKTALVLADPGGEPLDRLIHGPMEIKQFLRIAVSLTTAISHLHARELIHKDLKPSNVLVDATTGHVWLMGFGIASRLPRERQAPEPPEFIAGTLPYMAPEQTGRMNRSIDSRSDLYSLGVTLYEMLTGSLPFAASNPMEWVHCHIARQPVPPGDRLNSLPGSLSAIIMKLLAKTAEERYQTAAGVESDLRRCLAEWESDRRIEEFPLGAHDTPDRLLILEKLYGRESEIETLLGCFDHVVKNGRPELVLVSGYAGVGKSSVVNELHQSLVLPRGLFASGKFDQYKRDIPYATLAQAFQSLIRSILSKSETELGSWRDAFRDALGPNALLMVDLVPELKLIIGEQPPVPDLPPRDAQRRFHLVFRRFIGVFARPEHPLALFLDDLQWLDAATLDLLEDLLTQADVRHLLLIGAYRSNEVDAAHPLARKLVEIRQATGAVREIVLTPLSRQDLEHLLADSLHCEVDHGAPLAHLVHEKTGGNPFFAIQFITALGEEGLLTFDYSEGRWSWDLNSILAKGYTDNVADLMVGKLNRLPCETQRALQQLACIGNSAEFDLLETVCQDSKQDIHSDLAEAVRAGLLLPSEHAYRFLHDRVQEAAYSLITEDARGAAHLRIGRLLASRTAPAEVEEKIFEIVNQLNRGAPLIISRGERDQLAELNLLAGKRAKASTAYASALNYLIAGSATLAEDSWQRHHELAFELELHRAECEFLSGQPSAAEERLAALSPRARNTVELATVACLQIHVYTALDQNDRAVAICLNYLRHLGVEWSSRPTAHEVQCEYERIWSQIGSRQIEELIDLPVTTDLDVLGALNVLAEAMVPAMFCDEALSSLVICRIVNLSLEHGNSDASCLAYVWFATKAGPRFGNHEAGFRFGQLGYDLVEKRGLKRFQGQTYYGFGNVVLPWTRHAGAGTNLVRRAFDAANEIGDVTTAGMCCDHLMKNLLVAGDHLVEMQREAEGGLRFVQKVRYSRVVDHIKPQLGLIRTLRGLTPALGSLNDDQFDEVRFERYLASNPALAEPECWYWIRKLQARVFARDYASAVDASLRAQRRISTSPSKFMMTDPLETAEYHFYGGLAHASSWDSALSNQRQQHFESLVAHHRQLEKCAEHGPENFENRVALLAAEIARIEGRVLDAEQLFEQAIRSAHANGFIHNEALANELAARFYAARGFEKIAHAYLRDARYGYLRWGATGKVRQLDALYPQLDEEKPLAGPTSTIGTRVEHLDLATVIKVSQAVSGEIVFEKLIDRLMRTAIENAGAERGLLILQRGNERWIEAEAIATGDEVMLRPREVAVGALPESVVRYVARTRENVLLDNTAVQNPFSEDPYIRDRHARSILCLPLVHQGKLIGVLYLENNLTPHAFTPNRIAALKVLASQAAISLENTRLYAGLEEREAKIRRLVDANIIGIMIAKLGGEVVEANDAFLRMVGYSREDLGSGRIHRTDLTPPEWHDTNAMAEAQLRATGVSRPMEREFFRKDGSRVPVLVGSALFEQGGNEGVAFVLDLSDQKRAQKALRRSEEYLAEAQSLSHSGSWYWNVRTGEVTWSREYCAIFGFDFEKDPPSYELFIGRVHPDDRAKVEQVLSADVRENRDFHGEYRLLHPDGVIKSVHSIGRCRTSQSGDIEYVGAVIDITERKRAEEALRRSETYLAKAQRLSRTGSFGWNVSSGEVYWSAETFRIFEYQPTEKVTTEMVVHRTHPEDRAFVQQLIETVSRERKDFDIEHRLLMPDGSTKHVRVVGHPSTSGESGHFEFVGAVTDITDRKRSEGERERLHQLEADLAHINRVSTMGELTASLAHEIKQPMFAAAADAETCLRWLERAQPDVAEAQGAALRLMKDVTRASDIINRIVQLFKKDVPRRELVDVNGIIQEMIALLRSEAIRHSISIQSELTEGLPNLMADRVALQQVLMNLMLNAIEAMKELGTPGKLTITTREDENRQILVSVSDTGVGLPSGQTEQVFTAFFTSKLQGTGMGLPISRSIVESHGGRLWAIPNSARGATFQFTLPLEAPAQPDQQSNAVTVVNGQKCK